MPVMRAALIALVCLLAANARADHLYLHTREVEALLVHDGGLWVASSGGLERYDFSTLARTHHLTTEHGLDEPHVRALVLRDGRLFARTLRASCKVEATSVFCTRDDRAPPATSAASASFRGARVTARLAHARGELIATYGAGLWLASARGDVKLTPDGQVCTHHVQAAALFRERLYLGGFRDGLCVRRDGAFAALEVPFRYVNALFVHRGALYVAAHEGLFSSRDGAHFRREPRVTAHGVNGLAAHGHTLWVSTPGVLFALPERGRVRSIIYPGGSRSILTLAVDAAGTLWLASEDRGLLRMRGDHVERFDALRGLGSSWVVDVALARDGSAYAATLRDGVYHVTRDGVVEPVPRAPRWPLRLVPEEDELWIGSQDGLARRRADGQTEPPFALPDPRVHMVLRTATGHWIGTEHGLVERTLR